MWSRPVPLLDHLFDDRSDNLSARVPLRLLPHCPPRQQRSAIGSVPGLDVQLVRGLDSIDELGVEIVGCSFVQTVDPSMRYDEGYLARFLTVVGISKGVENQRDVGTALGGVGSTRATSTTRETTKDEYRLCVPFVGMPFRERPLRCDFHLFLHGEWHSGESEGQIRIVRRFCVKPAEFRSALGV